VDEKEEYGEREGLGGGAVRMEDSERGTGVWMRSEYMERGIEMADERKYME
jgi:hypothetical protein